MQLLRAGARKARAPVIKAGRRRATYFLIDMAKRLCSVSHALRPLWETQGNTVVWSVGLNFTLKRLHACPLRQQRVKVHHTSTRIHTRHDN